jgi:hypothetical protein
MLQVLWAGCLSFVTFDDRDHDIKYIFSNKLNPITDWTSVVKRLTIDVFRRKGTDQRWTRTLRRLCDLNFSSAT